MDALDKPIEIPIEDLDIIRAALSSAYHHLVVLDLADQYRKLTQRTTASPLSKALQNAVSLVEAYIEQASEPEDVT